jgi:hypothetical protein
MKVIAYILAVALFVLGILYYFGKVNWFTESGAGHPHHMTHLIICWVLALLALIWARFTGSPARTLR